MCVGSLGRSPRIATQGEHGPQHGRVGVGPTSIKQWHMYLVCPRAGRMENGIWTCIVCGHCGCGYMVAVLVRMVVLVQLSLYLG
eukprot:scaffold128666_cov35-Tisochrysis_lutea.AAC.3